MRSKLAASSIALAISFSSVLAAPPAPAIPQTPDGISRRLIQNGFTRASSQSLHIAGSQVETYSWRNEAEHATILATFKDARLQSLSIAITNPSDHRRTTTTFDADGKVTHVSVSSFE